MLLGTVLSVVGLAFFAPMPSPGERMGKKAVGAIQAMFERLGIAKRFGKKIDRFEPGGQKEQMVPLPMVGHWMKQAWGASYKASKRRQVPRLPGM